MPLTTRQCIEQIQLFAKQADKPQKSVILGIAYFLERHHQDIVNYTEEEDIPKDFLDHLDRLFEDVQRIEDDDGYNQIIGEGLRNVQRS